ncbi:MAG: hypothetical protein FJX74_02905 [Armatimonadetes bacterium]|nr:hypothetical protein [Armatimonadota bacterium]
MRTQKGQALLIAVLLMTVILLVGAIFVAITVYVQGQTQRHGQMRQAKQMCDSAVQHADRMLQLHTADWQPDDPPAWCDGGDGFDPLDQVLDPSYLGTDEFDPGFWGADGQPETEDDYYTPEELERGWCALRLEGALPPDPADPRFASRAAVDLDARGATVRRGFTRLPDPRQGIAAGADLLPSISEGHALLRVTYDPDPPFEGTSDEDPANPDPMSRMVRIESIGVVLQETFTFRRQVAYKPLALVNYARFITDQAGTGQPSYLGIPPVIDLDRDGATPLLNERHVTRIEGPVKSNSELVLVGEELPAPTPVDSASLQFEIATDSTGGRYVRRDTVEAAAGIRFRDRAPAPNDSQATVTIYSGGASTTHTIHPSNPQQPGDAAFATYGAFTGDGTAAVADGFRGTDVAGFGRFSPTLAAPPLFRRDPATDRTVYEERTRYSGDPVSTSGYWVNSGEWGHGDGVYVNNEADRQFLDARGECDTNTLIDDWLRGISPTDARAEDSGWNATHTTYTPPGVEIWIVGRELPAGTYVVQADPRSPVIPDTVLWAPAHAPRAPQIVLRRHDQRWRTAAGADSGRYAMVIDHPSAANAAGPTTQVILAAGNVRVWGNLPDRGPMPAPAPPQTAAAVPYPDYNLTLVSGGTIYIDGSILEPRDWSDPTNVNWATGAWDDRSTRLGLLARDCVCLNTTRIVPQEATALVSASPDDTNDPRPEASHWELTPEAGSRLFSTWEFGTAPAANVFLAASASGDDPGPAAMAMSLQQGWAPAWLPFDFAQGYAAADPRFYFLPPGVASAYNVSNALTPNYQPLPPGPALAPSVAPAAPWRLYPAAPPNPPGFYISTAPGVRNSLQMFWANPGMGAGATSPWVRNWKVVESASSDPTDMASIVPAVHARINATIYAETGCWFVIPGAFFQTVEAIDQVAGPAAGDNINGRIDTLDERARAATYLRYNYDITVRGSISESFTAPVDAVYEWTDKWACNTVVSSPNARLGGTLQSIRYEYDESVREARDRGGLGAISLPPGNTRRTTAAANLPKLPGLPVSADLIYHGETM